MKRLADQSFYEILEIPRDALPDDVEKAYERAKALFGPGSLATYTLMEPEEATLLGRRIEEARAVLLDPVMRASYDAGLPPEPERAGRVARPLPPVIPPVNAPPSQPERAGASQPEAPAPVLVAAPAGSQATASGAAVPPPVTPPEEVSARAVAPPVPPNAPPAAAAEAEESPQPPRPEPARPSSVPLHSAFPAPDGGPWTGEVLRRVREARGMTLRQISERTKVTRHHLENIEADRYARLPATVYLRGILMSLAKELRLDGQKVSRSYLEQMAQAQAQPPVPPKGR